MSLYDLNKRKGFLERERLNYTHAYFPQQKFHEVVLDKSCIFGRLGDVYIALAGKNSLLVNEKDSSDILQHGKITFWICEIGTYEEYGSFKSFCDTMRAREIKFMNGVLEYRGKNHLVLAYRKGFKVNDAMVGTEYDRFETPYVHAPRKPEKLEIKFGDRFLKLDFDKMVRSFN